EAPVEVQVGAAIATMTWDDSPAIAPARPLPRGTAARVVELVARVGGFPPERVSLRHRPIGQLGFDSLMVAELHKALLASFGVDAVPPPEFWQERPSVGELVDYISSRRAAVPRPETFSLSLASHPYLDDHRIGGKVFLPLASALDLLAWSQELKPPFSLGRITVERGVLMQDSARLRVERGESGLELREVRPTGREAVAFRGEVGPPGEAPDQGEEGEELPLELTLQEFYRSHTFHGPRLQGIESIGRLTTRSLEGRVRASCPSDLCPSDPRDSWCVDPVALDSAFQMALFWAQAVCGKGALPRGLQEFTLLEPLGPEPVDVRLELEERGEQGVRASIRFSCRGRLVGWVRGLQARWADGLARRDSIPEECYRIDRFPAYREILDRAAQAEAMGLFNPYFTEHDGVASNLLGPMIHFSGYNYLGLSGHPEVTTAASQAIQRYGTSVSASRLVSGQRPIHSELERELADFLGAEQALVMVSGHATNVSTIPCLVGPGDLVIHDSLIHDSAMQGARASRAARMAFPHNDVRALERMLEEVRANFRRVLVLAEGVYSMDGDVAPLPDLVALRDRFRFLLMVDEAHSIGTLGETGRG
ncbi:MAG: aminotransferase class I/II-fold pyridoxal phosphate-dependent enzyme, partial [Candidatus Eremiobacterota bacterium]